MEINFTRFRVYRECPWKFNLLYLQDQTIPPVPRASLGLTLHRTLERYLSEGQDDEERLYSLFDHEWVDGGFKDDAQRRTWRAKGRRILDRFLETERGRRTRIIGLEKEFIYRLGDHSVRGMIDRIDQHPDGHYEIIDYKTGVERDAPVGEDLQMRFYALGAREGLGLEPGELTIQYLASGRSQTAPYDPKGEAELKEMIVSAAEAIGQGRFDPDTGFCPRCGLSETCTYKKT